MIIRCISDLHLEFSDGNMYVPELPSDKDTVLILPGDIGIAKRSTTYKYFMEDMSYRFKEVVYVSGNHEHYSGHFPTTYTKISKELDDFDNVTLLEKATVRFDGVAIIGATMWTSMDGHNRMTMYTAESVMNDYRCVRTGPSTTPWKRKLRAADTVEDHFNAKHYIFEQIKKEKADGNKVIVVTHMSPSFQSSAEMYKGSDLNGAYCTELFEDIMDLEDAQPEVWCHGHLHNSSDYMIGNTRIICNPRGYFPSDLNDEFDPTFTVEL